MNEEVRIIKNIFNEIQIPIITTEYRKKSEIADANYEVWQRKKSFNHGFSLLFPYHDINKIEGFQFIIQGLKMLKKGEIAFCSFFNKKEKKNDMFYVSNPLSCSNLQILERRMGKAFFTLQMPKEYLFKESFFSYHPNLRQVKKVKRKEEAEFQLEIVNASKEIDEYGIIYENGLNSITVRVKENSSLADIRKDFRPCSIAAEELSLFSKVEITKVKDSVAIYRIFSKGNKQLFCEKEKIIEKDLGGSQEVCWMNNKNKMVKIITNPENKMSKEELIAICENVKGLN